MKYSIGFRGSIVRKVIDGSGRSVYQIAKETGISPTTINSWLGQHKAGTLSLDGCDAVTPGQRHLGEKLALVLESKNLTDEIRGDWLRRHGLHSEHLPLWEQELTSMLNDKQTDMRNDNAALRKENKRLQKENERQKKALAEAAILMTLKKKYHHLFAEDEEN